MRRFSATASVELSKRFPDDLVVVDGDTARWGSVVGIKVGLCGGEVPELVIDGEHESVRVSSNGYLSAEHENLKEW